MKKLTAILLIVAMMLTLGACSKKSDDADDSIKIGVMSTRTGENSLWGDVIYQTVQLLADDVNENGGLLGGRKIEILSYDNRDDNVYRQVPIYQIVDGEFKQIELYDLHA